MEKERQRGQWERTESVDKELANVGGGTTMAAGRTPTVLLLRRHSNKCARSARPYSPTTGCRGTKSNSTPNSRKRKARRTFGDLCPLDFLRPTGRWGQCRDINVLILIVTVRYSDRPPHLSQFPSASILCSMVVSPQSLRYQLFFSTISDT